MAQPEAKHKRRARKTVGLLGGSFNPAHEGHLHLSLEAIKRLELDEVWWLVSPQNPHNKKSDLAPYDQRIESAMRITEASPKIRISDFEAQQQLYFSIDTVTSLQQRHPEHQFIWLMGADNLHIFHKWHHWQQFFESLPIAIFDRAPFSHACLRQVAAQRYKHARYDEADARLLKNVKSPAWVYCFMQRHPLSATALRKTLGEDAFLRHNMNR
ncbi:MAG: nicotinate (nicotinamide) nucleotide adenylyltransferase [Rickettsiales bacterium]|nr:nicotinate (nicotinamide) nucleotide adenylyltransferase [Rickettsiales bacterium]